MSMGRSMGCLSFVSLRFVMEVGAVGCARLIMPAKELLFAAEDLMSIIAGEGGLNDKIRADCETCPS